jgi:molybdopterin-binding protein
MKISGRNILNATVKEVIRGAVMAKVVLDYKGDRLVSVITVDSVDDLGLKPGDQVSALIKSTSVMLIKE